MVVYDTSKQNKTINIYIQNRTYMTSGWQKMKIFKRIVIFRPIPISLIYLRDKT